MPKGFPYFKFIATNWLTGDIVFEDFDTQGLFINICALYWQRDGEITLEDIKKRYRGRYSDKSLEALQNEFFTIEKGKICIKFLDEQMDDAGIISDRNSEKGKKSAAAKAAKTLKNSTAVNSGQQQSTEINKVKESKVNESKVNESKTEVAEKVFLTEQQISKAKEFYLEHYDDAIATLSNYKMSSGKKYKSDYHALIGWVADRIKEKISKNGNNQQFAGNGSKPSKTDETIAGAAELRVFIKNGGIEKIKQRGNGNTGSDIVEPQI